MAKIVAIKQDKLLMLKENMASDTNVTNQDELRNTIKLYHGTDILALVAILKTKEVNASKGTQHGETSGINWFSLENTRNFNRGTCFSIEVPIDDFNKLFYKKNSGEATSIGDSLDISNYNVKVECFCDFDRNALIRYYDIITDKGERYPIETIRDNIFYEWCEKTNNEDTYMSVNDYDFGLIMANILGEDAVRNEGFLMEAAPETDVYEIGGEEDAPVGGRYYHANDAVNERYNASVRGNMTDIDLLTEGDSRLKVVNKMIENEFANIYPLDERVSDSGHYVNGNPNTTWREYLLFHLRHEFGLMQNSDVKYLPLTARIAYSDEVGFDKRDDNGTEVELLRQIIGKLKKDDFLFQEVKNDPSVTFSSLCEKFKNEIEAERVSDAEQADSMEDGESDYDIIEVNDFKTANEIGNYSCSESKLCYTQSEDTWDDWKGAKGQNRAYVCLKHGWENVAEEPTEGNPYDDYGLSMIFVFIDPDGHIFKSNCRWNHETVGKYIGGVDHAFTKTMLANVINKPFSSVFKPYPPEYLREIGYVSFKDAAMRLASGVEPKEIFDYVGYFRNGFASVGLNDKYNFINQEGQLISNQWFDNTYNFSDGFASVGLNDKYNFINQEGHLISDQWFDDDGSFYNGFAWVVLNGKCNFINQEGRIISDQWFDDVDDFSDGFAVVKLNDKWNYLNQEGRIISDQWFDYVGCFENGFARVWLNGKYNFLNQEGQYISDQWFDDAESFSDGFAWVKIGDNWYKLDTDGKLLQAESIDYYGSSLVMDSSIIRYIKHLASLNEETVADGSSNGNPYKDRWKAEREALKNFICNYGTVMQSKEDNKGGKLYKVLYDEGISQLIGYNYALCVQWDEIKLKPKSVVYVRALDKFTPNIRRNLQYDTRGYDNQFGTYDDLSY